VSVPAVVAYFSMEIALDPAMPTYAADLGVLAGDTLRSAADLEVPMVAVALLHRRGYFDQRLDARGEQSEEPVTWPVEGLLEPVGPPVEIDLEGRTVWVRAWRYPVTGASPTCSTAATPRIGCDMALARLVCAGVDVWLNTPLPPLEASGTSGMKAAMNGVPSLSVLDGWRVEGRIEGVTGWAIGGPLDPASEGSPLTRSSRGWPSA